MGRREKVSWMENICKKEDNDDNLWPVGWLGDGMSARSARMSYAMMFFGKIFFTHDIFILNITCKDKQEEN